jgi:hypothetical protein
VCGVWVGGQGGSCGREVRVGCRGRRGVVAESCSVLAEQAGGQGLLKVSVCVSVFVCVLNIMLWCV